MYQRPWGSGKAVQQAAGLQQGAGSPISWGNRRKP